MLLHPPPAELCSRSKGLRAVTTCSVRRLMVAFQCQEGLVHAGWAPTGNKQHRENTQLVPQPRGAALGPVTRARAASPSSALRGSAQVQPLSPRWGAAGPLPPAPSRRTALPLLSPSLETTGQGRPSLSRCCHVLCLSDIPITCITGHGNWSRGHQGRAQSTGHSWVRLWREPPGLHRQLLFWLMEGTIHMERAERTGAATQLRIQ